METIEKLQVAPVEERKQRAFDARETSEMLHAAYTLLRMAFGATALIPDIAPNETAAKELTATFNDCLKRLADSFKYYHKVFLDNNVEE